MKQHTPMSFLMKKMSLLLAALLFTLMGYSQVMIVSNTVGLREQFMVDNLYQISVVNTSTKAISGRIRGVILDGSQREVAEVYSGPLNIEAGASVTGKQIPWQGVPRFGRLLASQQLRETGQLTPGNYTVCYQVLNTQGTTLANNCLEQRVRPSGPPELLYPANGEQIETPNPALTWRGPLPMPLGADIDYRIKLVEMRPGQKPERAVVSNAPLLEQTLNTISNLNYPLDAPPLEEGKTYAWQVQAYTNQFELGKTSVWQFTYKVPKDLTAAKALGINDTYRFARPELNGRFYKSNAGFIRFAYDNRSGLAQLPYELVAFHGSGKTTYTVPSVSLSAGLNLIDLNISALFTTAQKLVLTIKEPNGHRQYLEIDYQP